MAQVGRIEAVQWLFWDKQLGHAIQAEHDRQETLHSKTFDAIKTLIHAAERLAETRRELSERLGIPVPVNQIVNMEARIMKLKDELESGDSRGGSSTLFP
jgi:hypothetical protein